MGLINAIINGIKSQTVSINGKTYAGNNVHIKQNKVFVDGIEVECEDKVINISINGDVGNVDTLSGDVVITGNAKSVNTTSGDVRIGRDVTGDVETVSGDVDVRGDIEGNVTTVSGDVST